MASQYVIDLGYNDDLTTVIKKVNHNFKAVVGPFRWRSRLGKRH